MSLKKRGKFWHYEVMIDGERYWGTTRETVKSRAQTFEAERITEIRRGTIHSRVRHMPKLSEFAVEFLEYIDACAAAGSMAAKTQHNYHWGWKLLQGTEVARLPIDRITRANTASVKFGFSGWSARGAQKTLKRILNYAVELGLLQTSPSIKLAKAYGRSELISPTMEAALLKNMSPDAQAVLTIMMDSGMRPDEVMRMEWSNVNWDRSAIFVPCGKTPAARRFVPLSDRVRGILEDRQRTHASKWVFPGKTAEGRRNTIKRQFQQARAAAGIGPEVALYSARHTFATNLSPETGDLALVQRVMGHESITTTQRYLHPEIGGVAKLVNDRNARNRLHLVA